jgi:hypothetical protein
VCRALVFVSLASISIGFTACGARAEKGGTGPILLFNGTGTSPNDVAAVEAILKGNDLEYATVNSSELNAMGESQIGASRLLIVPGGNFVDIGHGLTSGTTANIRHPEAPASWRHGMTFATPASEDNAYAGTLIRAALDRTSLSHY